MRERLWNYYKNKKIECEQEKLCTGANKCVKSNVNDLYLCV